MAYFPNGTAGMQYEDRYCSRCVHRNGPDGKSGCAVWLLHLLYSYKLCNSKCPGKDALDTLIPEDKNGFPEMCAMFHEGDAIPTPEEKNEKSKRHIMPAMKEWAKERGLVE